MRADSSGPRGTANAKAPNSGGGLGEIGVREAGGHDADPWRGREEDDRHRPGAPAGSPARASNAAAPVATIPAYSSPVRLTQASASPRESGHGTMNHAATTLADSGYHACIVNAWAGLAAAIACSRSHSAG